MDDEEVRLPKKRPTRAHMLRRAAIRLRAEGHAIGARVDDSELANLRRVLRRLATPTGLELVWLEHDALDLAPEHWRVEVHDQAEAKTGRAQVGEHLLPVRRHDLRDDL